METQLSQACRSSDAEDTASFEPVVDVSQQTQLSRSDVERNTPLGTPLDGVPAGADAKSLPTASHASFTRGRCCAGSRHTPTRPNSTIQGLLTSDFELSR